MRKRKIKFALELKDGEEARSMEELRANFDLEKIIGYFQDGRLVTWLDNYFYADEADEIRKLSGDEPDLGERLCNILGTGYTEVGDTETIVWRKQRLERLKQYTANPDILNRVDVVAFDQEDLEDIIREEDTDIIYLCQNKFTFPSGILRKKNVRYVGIGKNVNVIIQSKKSVDFEALGIEFDNVEIEDPRIYEFEKYLQAAEQGNKKAMMSIAELYDDENFDGHDTKKAMEWYHKAAKAGDSDAMMILGASYEYGSGIDEDIEIAAEWYLKAAEAGNADAMFSLAMLYDDDKYSEKNEEKFYEWLKKAAEAGSEGAQKWLECGWRK